MRCAPSENQIVDKFAEQLYFLGLYLRTTAVICFLKIASENVCLLVLKLQQLPKNQFNPICIKIDFYINWHMDAHYITDDGYYIKN